MLRDYELFHGAILREIIISASRPITIAVDDIDGRINSFVLDGRAAISLKHCEKKLTPWSFTFSMDQINELIRLKERYGKLWMGLICWKDGVVFITPQQFLTLTSSSETQHWIRVHRAKNQMYSLRGSGGELDSKIRRGAGDVLTTLSND